MQYDPSSLGGIPEASLGLYRWDGQTWTLEPGSTLDTTAHTLSAVASSLGTWAVRGEGSRLFLPVLLGRSE